MEFVASGLSEIESSELHYLLDDVCAAANVTLDGDAPRIVTEAVELHQKKRKALQDTSRLGMRPLPPGVAYEDFIEPWLADQALPDEVVREHSVDSAALLAQFPAACPLGARMKELHFNLNPRSVFLNTGSYGATPNVVLAARQEWERIEMRDPVQWRAYVAPQLLRRVKSRIAQLVHAHPADVVLMVNCNTATSTVLKSIPWEAGDVLLLFTCDYDATKLAAKFLEQAYGVVTVYVEIVLPLTDSEIVRAIDTFLSVRQRQGEKMPRLANFCHVTSKTAWIFPAKEITEVFHRYGVPVFVDGAQAPGHIPVDVIDINADFYTGTCHKWLFSCQGTAFLVVAPKRQDMVKPLAPNLGYTESFSHAFAESMSHDVSTFLAILQAFDFVDRVCGGWAAVMSYNRELARQAVKELTEMWELWREGLHCVQEMQLGDGPGCGNCMPIVPLPQSRNATSGDATKLMGYLLTKCSITAFLLIERFRFGDEIRSCMAVRITCQIHVSLEDVRRLGRAVRELNGTYGALGVIKEYLPDAMHSMTS